MNERPTDPAWVALADQLASEAGEKLNALVVMIAVQDKGKLGVAIADSPRLQGEEIADMRSMAKDMPRFLLHLARILWLYEQSLKAPEVIFEPGAFDAFEGTPDELRSLIADIRNKFASGEAQRTMKRLTPEEEDEIAARVAAAAKRRARPM